jgi:hypothetical protein
VSVSSRSAPDAVGAPPVDQRAAGHGQQPGARPVGYAVSQPLHRGGEQRLLYGILTRVELAVPAHQRAEDLRRVQAQQVLDARLVGHGWAE